MSVFFVRSPAIDDLNAFASNFIDNFEFNTNVLKLLSSAETEIKLSPVISHGKLFDFILRRLECDLISEGHLDNIKDLFGEENLCEKSLKAQIQLKISFKCYANYVEEQALKPKRRELIVPSQKPKRERTRNMQKL